MDGEEMPQVMRPGFDPEAPLPSFILELQANWRREMEGHFKLPPATPLVVARPLPLATPLAAFMPKGE